MRTVLVTGASGQQGRAVVRHLLALNVPVRAMLRNSAGEAARELALLGCEVVAGDLDRPESIAPALQGVRCAFLMTALSDEQTELRRGRAFIRAAVEQRLGYLVFSAALDALHDTSVPHFQSKRQLMAELAASGLHHSVLMPGGFMENLLFPQTWNGLAKGRLVTPFRVDIPQALIAVDDIGRFAARCLAAPPPQQGERYLLYSECLSASQQAALMAQQIGHPIRAIRLPWLLTRLLLGSQLTAMFNYYNRGAAHTAPKDLGAAQVLSSPTRFTDWFADQWAKATAQ